MDGWMDGWVGGWMDGYGWLVRFNLVVSEDAVLQYAVES